MSVQLLSEIHSAVRRGAKLYIGRNYYGRVRLKIVQGPFGLSTKRISLRSEELQQVFDNVNLRRAAA